ncbi:MAG: lipoprotein [Gammaproteobacteria bacterium]|nr:lipoprotein [Gammaproteobacteria bacterium]
MLNTCTCRLLLLCLTLLIAGCGAKGDLYLPAPPPQKGDAGEKVLQGKPQDNKAKPDPNLPPL